MIAPAFSPCGAVVGAVRSCYDRPCQWYPGGPIGRIRYYFVPKTNARLPGVNVFHPYSTFVSELENTSQTGERTPSYKWYRGNPPVTPIKNGKTPCGTAADFAGVGTSPLPGGYVALTDLCGCDWPNLYWFSSGQGLLAGGTALVTGGGHDLYVRGIGLLAGGAAWVRSFAPTTGQGLLAGGAALVSGGGVGECWVDCWVDGWVGDWVGSKPKCPYLPARQGLLAGGAAAVTGGQVVPAGVGLLAGGTPAIAGGGTVSDGVGLLVSGAPVITGGNTVSTGSGLLVGGNAAVSTGPQPEITGQGLLAGGAALTGWGASPPVLGAGLLAGGTPAIAGGGTVSGGIGLLLGGTPETVGGGTVSGGVGLLVSGTPETVGGGSVSDGQGLLAGGAVPTAGGGSVSGGAGLLVSGAAGAGQAPNPPITGQGLLAGGAALVRLGYSTGTGLLVSGAATVTGGGAGGGTTGDCALCPSAPIVWLLTVSGITGSSDCMSLDGTYHLRHTSGCSWPSDEFNDVTGTWAWRLDAVFTGFAYVWVLRAGNSLDPIYADYRLAHSGWDCLGTNVLTLLTSTGCTFPGTLTLTPDL